MGKNMLRSKDYTYYMKVERNMSPNTIDGYLSDLTDLFEWLGDREPDTESIISYLSERSDKVSKRTQARMLSSFRSYFDWLILEGERKSNPCDGVESPKLGRHLPDVLSVDEVLSIIDSVDTSTWNGVRDKAILEMLYGCGLRVSELCNLRISDIYASEGFVKIVGKGNKQRIVPSGQPAMDAFYEYIAVRPEPYGKESEDIVFLNKFGKPLSRVSVFNMIKKQALVAGVNKTISPHTFRHSFATHMIENGADLRVVQEMLGHESILTTEIYTHIDQSTWQQSILSHHPRK